MEEISSNLPENYQERGSWN